MLASLRFEITNASYPDYSLPLEIFAGSFLSFLFGYVLIRTIGWKQIGSNKPIYYQIETRGLRRLLFWLATFACAIMIYNYVSFGLPPLFSFFGRQTRTVDDYGRWKQLLGPVISAIFVNSFLDESKRRKMFYATFGFASMLLYVARGNIMMMVFQAFVVFTIRSKVDKKKLYLAALAGVLLAVIFFGIIGDFRTSNALLYNGLQIKTEFQEWPTIYVWIIAYISVPLSNLCWFVKTARFDHPTWSFTYQMLPAFWFPPGVHDQIQHMSKVVDGVHTYLANYFLDFSYLGIFLINCFIGVLSGVTSLANRVTRKFLVSSILLSCITFIFFWDFFASLNTLILLVIESQAQRFLIIELPSNSPKPARAVG